MTKHSIAEARERLPDLIERALRGEDVVITREGAPVVQLKAVPEPRRLTEAEISWVEKRRLRPSRPIPDAATLVRQLRDEERM